MLFIAALTGAIFIAGCIKDRAWQIGDAAPEISALDLNDQTVKLSDFRGKVVVVRFWSAGCKACLDEMPVIDAFSKRHNDKGLAVLAVNRGESKERVEKFVIRLNISYPVLLDPAAIASKKYSVTTVPTTFFIDRNGIARKVVPGPMTQEQFEKTILELLKESQL
jgi:peroxiredoxin